MQFLPTKRTKVNIVKSSTNICENVQFVFYKDNENGFSPTRKNVEAYIGWANEKEDSLPNSIIKLFIISVMNMNSNASFSKWLKKKHLSNLKMPVLVMFGENEFAFSIQRATKRAKCVISNLDLQIVDGASHLLSVSKPDYINAKVLEFMNK